MVRILLFALVFAALNVAAIARCCSGLPEGAASGHASHASHHHEPSPAPHDAGCGEPGHICQSLNDLAVLAAAPAEPSVVKAVEPAAAVAAVAVLRPPVQLSARRYRPPDWGSGFKSTYGKIGRLLI